MEKIQYHDLINLVNDDINIALNIHYNENFLKKDLIMIAEYYEISIRKKRKTQLIKDIIDFETNEDNIFLVERRKQLWEYIEEIRNDRYLSKFLILK